MYQLSSVVLCSSNGATSVIAAGKLSLRRLARDEARVACAKKKIDSGVT